MKPDGGIHFPCRNLPSNLSPPAAMTCTLFFSPLFLLHPLMFTLSPSSSSHGCFSFLHLSSSYLSHELYHYFSFVLSVLFFHLLLPYLPDIYFLSSIHLFCLKPSMSSSSFFLLPSTPPLSFLSSSFLHLLTPWSSILMLFLLLSFRSSLLLLVFLTFLREILQWLSC